MMCVCAGGVDVLLVALVLSYAAVYKLSETVGDNVYMQRNISRVFCLGLFLLGFRVCVRGGILWKC